MVRNISIPVAVIAATLAVALLPGASPAEEIRVAQLFGGETDRRLDALEAEVQAIRREISSGGGSALQRLSDVEAELRALNAQLEELRFKLDRIAEDAGRRFGDIEFRLTELEGGDIAAVGDPRPLGGGSTGGGFGGGAGSGSTGGGQPLVVAAERAELDDAIRLVQQGRSDLAEENLRRFINSNPNSSLAGEARFWIGESQFVRGYFGEAASSYLAGYNADQSGPLAADNLMKLGVTLGRLGQISEACLTLREVGRQFPGASRAVEEANGEANRLSCG